MNVYAANVGAPKYIEQVVTATEGDIGSDTVAEGTQHHIDING